MKYDFIIVGQGIAGTVLSDHLMSAGLEVLVIDNSELSNSSRVAGGLYNPITGRKMVKTWRADDLFNYLQSYYTKLEEKLEAAFLNDKAIYRPFFSFEELNEWMGKSIEPEYASYIKEVFGHSEYGNHVNDEYGGLLLNRCGYLDTVTLLDTYRKHLDVLSRLKKEAFDFNELNLTAEGVDYKGDSARRIIFADGQLLRNNSFFNWLPLKPVKGELLYVRVEEPIDVIYNRGVFVIPIGDGICKVGSTYDHNNLNSVTTKEAKLELTKRLKDLVNFKFEVVDQKAGVRPATKDRKPFIGIHPAHDQIGIFNGFGTKGVSLVPYFANQFVGTLTKGAELDPEVNIRRFFSLYWKPFNKKNNG
jgi:glycine/D-amino acid oxidase-like deaminating enzyme